MIGRLFAGYERARQFAVDLTVFGATLVGVVAATVARPDPARFPMRCRSCGRRIRIASREHPSAGWQGRAMYRDPSGGYACDGTIRTRHTPDTTI